MTIAQYGVGVYRANESSFQIRSWFDRGGSKAVIGLHGADGSSLQFSPTQNVGPHSTMLARRGYTIFGIDAGGLHPFSDPDEMTAIDTAVTYVLGSGGCSGPKVGIMAWSMGGLAALNYIKRNPAKVACAWLWAPLTDLRWAYSEAGYTPAYGGTVANNASWTSEIDADFNTYATNSAGYRVVDEPASWRGIGVPIRVCQASDDAVIPPAMNTDATNGFVAKVNDPLVTLRTPLPTGGHTALFGSIPYDEVASFFASYL